MAAARGTLVLVVGPSGAGKDTMIDGARARLADDPRFAFARRQITRPAKAGGEAHVEISETQFLSRAQAGDYLMHWWAHGLGYGISIDVASQLAGGRHVVANVSRTVIAKARIVAPPVAVAAIHVDPDVLRHRLLGRGRESAQGIEDRIARAGAYRVDGGDVVRIANDGPPEAAIGRFVEALRSLQPVAAD